MERTAVAKRIRSFTGVVVSAKTPKTLVVEVMRMTKHPKYGKIYASHQRYHVHDPRGSFKTGDRVTFVACRPISRTKRWLVVYDEAQNAKRKAQNNGNYSVRSSPRVSGLHNFSF